MNVAREALLVDARALVAAHLPNEPVAKLDVGLRPSGGDGGRAHRDPHPRRRVGAQLGLRRPDRALVGGDTASNDASNDAPPSFDVPINPEHPDADRIRIERTTPFAFDACSGAQRS